MVGMVGVIIGGTTVSQAVDGDSDTQLTVSLSYKTENVSY